MLVLAISQHAEQGSALRPRRACALALGRNSTIPMGPVIRLVSVVLPVKRLEIAQVVSSAFGYRFNVVDFPSVVTCGSVGSLPYPSVTGILAVFIRIIARNDFAFFPNGINGLLIEAVPGGGSIVFPCHLGLLRSQRALPP